MQVLFAKRDKRLCDKSVGTVFVVKGVKVEEGRLNRFGKGELAKSSDYISLPTSISVSRLKHSSYD